MNTPSQLSVQMRKSILRICGMITVSVLVAVLQPPLNASAQSSCMVIIPKLPTNNSIKNQSEADCLAWQQFIYLNWRADPVHAGHPDINAEEKDFGNPKDNKPKVWQSYLEPAVLFNPTKDPKLKFENSHSGVLQLSAISKTGSLDIRLGDNTQAGGGWLTTQRGDLTYYQVLINEDEYEFIERNGLNTIKGQTDCAKGNGGFILPQGGYNGFPYDIDCNNQKADYGQKQGTIEIKAAWIPLPKDHSLDNRYLTSTAQIIDAFGNKTPDITVGLVGLHIVHKFLGAYQFVWSTFEHIDNSPDDNNGKPADPCLPPSSSCSSNNLQRNYTYYNPNCNSQIDPYQCQKNVNQKNICNVDERTSKCPPYSSPMQVTRKYSVGPKANATTGLFWKQIPKGSVFNYYRLIDVQWPSIPQSIAPGQLVPLPDGNIRSENKTMANTTMETSMQDQSCMNCHQCAPIARLREGLAANATTHMERTIFIDPKDKNTANIKGSCTSSPSYASDYSFIFSSETKQ